MPNAKQFVYNENCYFPVKIDSRCGLITGKFVTVTQHGKVQ